jgi:hypothetical protein
MKMNTTDLNDTDFDNYNFHPFTNLSPPLRHDICSFLLLIVYIY